MLEANLCQSLSMRTRCSRASFFVKLSIIVAVILCGSIIIYNGVFRREVIVDGWKANADRYAMDFVSPNHYTNLTTVNNPCAYVESFHLLVIVTSAIKNFEQRETIRETWATLAKHYLGKISILFLVGLSERGDLNKQILAENMKHRDVIVENFLDTYYNLTLKSIMLLKWVEQNCKNAAFVMKMDDDVYLNVNNLIKLTKDEHVPAENLLIGKLYAGLKPDRRISSKWYVPEYFYSRSTYPDFLCGVGFLMSGDVALRLYRESFKFKLFFLEDMFITGMCAENTNVRRRNHIGFHFFEHAVKIECNAIHPEMILLSHYVSPRDMRKMHYQLTECNE